MGEPFSVAGSAVGVVSLGLGVCKGLISYYEAYKTQNSDIAQAYDQIDGLKNTFACLHASLSQLNPSNPIPVDNVRERILSCEKGIGKLREKLDECSRCAVPKTYKEKIQKSAQKALYPFKKDTLQSLKTIVTELQDNLSISIQALDCRWTCNSFDELLN